VFVGLAVAGRGSGGEGVTRGRARVVRGLSDLHGGEVGGNVPKEPVENSLSNSRTDDIAVSHWKSAYPGTPGQAQLVMTLSLLGGFLARGMQADEMLKANFAAEQLAAVKKSFDGISQEAMDQICVSTAERLSRRSVPKK
jgi:hypothetical protein